MNILVLNAGSSTIKYRLYDMAKIEMICSGVLEHLHEENNIKHCLRDHSGERCEQLLQAESAELFAHILYSLPADSAPAVIAHRVVHGGREFTQPCIVDDAVLESLRANINLAPLHNPANIAGMEAARTHAPDLPQVAVFDTAFHQAMPEHAWRYALPEKLAQSHQLRRFGFHGIAHQYLVECTAEILGQPPGELNLITLHLGNGASAAAIAAGRCVDTSMGMTPMEGLVMGSRSGDLDPGIIFSLLEQGMSTAEIKQQLNYQSGLQGLCGSNDMRVIEQRVEEGDRIATLTLEIFCYRIRKYIGAYTAVLGRVDALVFSGGIGEHSARVRQQVCDGLSGLGWQLDTERNRLAEPLARRLEEQDSHGAILVIPANEELQIARQAHALMQGRAGSLP